MRARDFHTLAEKLRADGLTTGQIVERWTHERNLNPREAARLSHGLTQQAAADAYNELFPAEHPCTRQTVCKWETSRQPSLEALNKLARVYRCAAGDLLGGADWSHLDGRPQHPGAAVLEVAVCVVTRGGEVLLVRSRNSGWQFPSGHVKPDQDAAERAVEETAAETGVRCRIIGHLGGRVHPVTSAWCEYFTAEYLAGDVINGQPAENSDVTWAPIGSLFKFIDRARVFPPILDHLESTVSEPTVAMAIVTSEQGVLLAARRDGKPAWTFPGGGIEAGESISDAAVREVKEETGLSVTAGRVLGERVHPKTGKCLAYVAAQPVNGLEVHVGDPEEHSEVRWVPWVEAQELLPGVFEPVAAHLDTVCG